MYNLVLRKDEHFTIDAHIADGSERNKWMPVMTTQMLMLDSQTYKAA